MTEWALAYPWMVLTIILFTIYVIGQVMCNIMRLIDNISMRKYREKEK